MEITFDNLDSIVSEVPNFMGFVPTESIVLVAIRHSEGTMSSQILAARADLPQPEHRRDIAEYFATVFGPNTTDLVIAVVISDEPMQEYREFVDQLSVVFAQRHEIGFHAVWTTLRPAEEWLCYHDSDCRGVVYETRSSPLAAAAAVSGSPRYGSRAEIEASLAPVSDAERADWARRLDQRPRPEESTSLGDRAAPVFAALKRLRAGQSLETHQAVAVLDAISSDARVRDVMFTVQEPAALQLWTMLVRHAPEDEVADPAMLLAVAEYLHGNGPVANVALQRALTADPQHRGAQLLRRVFHLPPDTLLAVLRELTEDFADQLD